MAPAWEPVIKSSSVTDIVRGLRSTSENGHGIWQSAETAPLSARQRAQMSLGERARQSVLVAALLVCWSLCAAASDADLKEISVAVEVAGDLVTIDASLHIAASPKEVWEVLTDFDHMAEIVTNLQSSKVLSRSATTLVVAQQGR